jgi:aspartate/methionine/tyrosine aminotransferase
MIKFSGAKGIPLELNEEDNFEININKLEKLITKNTSLDNY